MEEQTLTTPIQESPVSKPTKKNFPKPLIFITLFLFLLVSGMGILFITGFFSNRNIPVISNIIEKIETAIISDQEFAEMASDEMSKFLITTIVDSNKLGEYKPFNVDASDSFLENFTKELSSYKFKNDLKVETNSIELALNTQGSVDNAKNDFKLDTAFDVSYDDPDADNEVEFSGEARFLDERFYLLASEIANSKSEDLSFLNKWYYLDIDDLTETDSEDLGYMSFDELNSSTKLDEDQIEKIDQLIKGDTIRKSIKRLPDMVLDDEETFGKSNSVRANCFEMDLDGDDVVSLIMEISDIWDLDTNYFDEDSFEDISDMFRKVNVEICTGRRDHQIYRYAINLELNDFADGDTDLEMEAYIWDQNKAVEIAEPEDATNFQDSSTDIWKEYLSKGLMMDPEGQLQDARNSERRVDVNAILQATSVYFLDYIDYPTIDGKELTTLSIENGVATCKEEGACDASKVDGLTPYLSKIPTDPEDNSEYLVGVDDADDPKHIIVATNNMEVNDNQDTTLYYLTY